MRGSDIAAGLQDHDLGARSDLILEHVQAGHALELRWATIVSTIAEKNVPRWIAYFRVTTDALRLGDADSSFRVTLPDKHLIQLAQMLGLSRTTGKLADLAWAQSPVKLNPVTMGNTDAALAIMATTRQMVAHSSAVDAQLVIAGNEELTLLPSVLRRPVGKDWCASSLNVNLRSGGRKATNYGWHLKRGTSKFRALTMPTVYVYQPFASAHDWTHVDYSQVATFVHPLVQLQDVTSGETTPVGIDQINADSSLAYLLSHNGTIKEALTGDGGPSAEIHWTTYGAAGLVTIAAIAAAVRMART